MEETTGKKVQTMTLFRLDEDSDASMEEINNLEDRYAAESFKDNSSSRGTENNSKRHQ